MHVTYMLKKTASKNAQYVQSYIQAVSYQPRKRICGYGENVLINQRQLKINKMQPNLIHLLFCCQRQMIRAVFGDTLWTLNTSQAFLIAKALLSIVADNAHYLIATIDPSHTNNGRCDNTAHVVGYINMTVRSVNITSPYSDQN